MLAIIAEAGHSNATDDSCEAGDSEFDTDRELVEKPKGVQYSILISHKRAIQLMGQTCFVSVAGAQNDITQAQCGATHLINFCNMQKV